MPPPSRSPPLREVLVLLHASGSGGAGYCFATFKTSLPKCFEEGEAFLSSPIVSYVGDMASTHVARVPDDDEFKSIPLAGLSTKRKLAVEVEKYAELLISDESLCTRGSSVPTLPISHTGDIT